MNGKWDIFGGANCAIKQWHRTKLDRSSPISMHGEVSKT